MLKRQEQYYGFRRSITMLAKYGVTLLLSNRNYTGKINFDHEKELVTMSVSITT